MPYLYLIRHPRTHVDPTRQPHEWELSEQGRAQVTKLIEAPFLQRVKALYSSNQPKAIEAAKQMGQAFTVPVTALPGLAEVWRGAEVYLTATQYDEVLGRFFSLPHFSVEGWEMRSHRVTFLP